MANQDNLSDSSDSEITFTAGKESSDHQDEKKIFIEETVTEYMNT